MRSAGGRRRAQFLHPPGFTVMPGSLVGWNFQLEIEYGLGGDFQHGFLCRTLWSSVRMFMLIKVVIRAV